MWRIENTPRVEQVGYNFGICYCNGGKQQVRLRSVSFPLAAIT